MDEGVLNLILELEGKGVPHCWACKPCHLEFAIPAWSPWLVGNIEILERVQKRAVNMIVGLRSKTYEEKLTKLGLTTLEICQKHYDLVQTFKILNGFDSQPVYLVSYCR